ncbi:MAG TPA: hypothetical protein VFI41_12700 [Gemmatimonadales bacterium]|nr:hypothetical protein [Gemmatimonadales bacterium]
MAGGQATTTTSPDGKTQNYQDVLRQYMLGLLGSASGNQALTGQAGQYGTNLGLPDPTALKDQARAEFDRQRTQAGLSAADMATKAGAFGGDRSAILQAQLVNGVNQNEASTLAGIDYQNQNDQWQRLMQLANLAGGGAQWGGSTQTQQMPGNPFGTIAGLAATAGGLGWSPFK